MFNQIITNARVAIGGQLAWLLTHQDDQLLHRALDCEAPDNSQRFLDLLAEEYPAYTFPAEIGDNLLGDVLLRNIPLVGLSVDKLTEVIGATPLKAAFENLNLPFITLIPLRYGKLLNGLLLLGHDDDRFIRSDHGQNLIKVLRRQISLEIDYKRLETYVDRVEDERRQRNKLYQDMLTAIDDAALVVDDQNRVLHANERFCIMTAFRPDKIVGRSVNEMVIAGDKNEQHYIRDESGSLLNVSLRAVPLDVEIDDTVIRRLLIFKDRSRLQTHEIALEQQTRRLRTLNMASRAINSPIGLQDVIQVVLSSAHEVVSGEAAALLLRDDEDDLIVVATRGIPDIHGRAVTIGMGIVGWVAKHAESLLVNDVEQDPRYRSYVDSSTTILTRSMIAIPLITTAEVIGVLVVINCANGDFITEDLEILENLGAAAATAIENATLFDQTNRRLTELSTILDASAMATSTMGLQVIVEHISRRLREALGIQRVNIYTSNADDDLERVVAVTDSQWEPERALAIPIGRVPTKQEALQKTVFIELETGKLTEEEMSELRLRGATFAANAPLKFNQEVVGVITLYNITAFTETDTNTIQSAVERWEQETDMPSEGLGLLCHRLLQATESRWCTIYLLNNARDKLLMLYEMGTGFWGEHMMSVLEKTWLPSAENVLQTANAIPTSRFDSEAPREKQYLALLGITNAMIAPIVQHGEAIGIIELAASDHHEFDDSAMSLTTGIANIIGNAIESSSLYNSLEQRAEALEAAYHELEQADRLKDELLQNMSHELGTPLTHILGYLSLLEEHAFGALNTQQTDIVTQAVRKTQHVADLVKQMVVVHASNSMNLNLKETKLEQLAALAVRTLAPRAEEMGIEILPRISRNLPVVMVDQVAMSEVFEALIDNALKFSGDGKEIEIEIRDTGSMMIKVAIKDKGIGIPQQEQARVFRQFYQIDGSTTRAYGGMGLGLAIVRKIIDAHGGRVWLESEVGQGTTVHFTVPKATTPVGKAQNVFALS
jgi:signal transduction histidine kinase/PAS domain-containing protein